MHDPISNVGATLKKTFLDKNNLRYENEFINAEDYGLIAKILMHGEKIKILKKVLTGYRMHNTNGKKYRETQINNSLKIKALLKNYFVDNVNGFDACHIYKNLNNKIQKVFSKEEIELAIKKYCNH